MRFIVSTGLLLTMLACSAAPRSLSALPIEMRGAWSGSAEGCGARDDGAVEIGDQFVAFAVSRYDLQSIVASGQGVRAEAIVREEGYEEAAQASITLRLVDRDSLLITTSTGEHRYTRCAR